MQVFSITNYSSNIYKQTAKLFQSEMLLIKNIQHCIVFRLDMIKTRKKGIFYPRDYYYWENSATYRHVQRISVWSLVTRLIFPQSILPLHTCIPFVTRSRWRGEHGGMFFVARESTKTRSSASRGMLPSGLSTENWRHRSTLGFVKFATALRTVPFLLPIDEEREATSEFQTFLNV